MPVIVGCWHRRETCVCLNLSSVLQNQQQQQRPEAQKKMKLFFEIIRWKSLDLPWRGKTSSYASRREVVKPEFQFILPRNIWTTGGHRGFQGKWSSWWTRYNNLSLVGLTYGFCTIMLTYLRPLEIQRKHSIFQSICTCGSAHHKLHAIRFRYSPALWYYLACDLLSTGKDHYFNPFWIKGFPAIKLFSWVLKQLGK